MEMGQGTRKKTKGWKTSNFPTPKHREMMYQIYHWTIQTCQSEWAIFLGENVGLSLSLFI